MNRSILSATSILLLSCSAVFAAPVSQTFTGVTYLNQVTSTKFTEEFPLGTRWTVLVEWDDASDALFESSTQGQYRLTKFTLSLAGKSKTWTTSSLADQASINLGIFGSLQEVQFTSGWGPTSQTNPTLADMQAYSSNVVLSDDTGTALPGLGLQPGKFDLKVWNPSKSLFKIYLSDSGTEVVYGSIDGVGEVTTPLVPEISIQQPKGTELKDAKSVVYYDAVKKGRVGQTKTFVIRNKGTSTLKGLRLVIGGIHRKDFITEGLLKKSLAPGAKTSFQVTFKPAAVGKRKAIVKVESNDEDENPFTVSLRGTGK